MYWELIRRLWPLAFGLALFASGYLVGYRHDHKAMQAKLDALQTDYDHFQTEVRVQGEIAQKAADETRLKDRKAKEDSDNALKTDIDRLTAERDRLRDKDRRRPNILPAPTASASDPAYAKINRSEYELAYRHLVDGLRAVGSESSEGIAGLDSARDWAQGVPVGDQ